MPSPFPGMDPYIEAQGPWGDFHDSLIQEIKDAIIPSLPERYVALTGERAYIDYIDPREDWSQKQRIGPDVGVWSQPTPIPARTAQEGSVAVAEAHADAIVMHGLVEVEFRDIFLEIYELDPERRLVTCIEILSPSNKRFPSVGWYQYERKRQVFLKGYANLVEIDLLRGGRRMPMEESWPDSPYFVVIFRKEQAPEGVVLPAHYRRPLPAIPIPLALPDPDISLPLQSLVDAIYDRSRYRRLIDYGKPLQPPLVEADQTWLQERIREWQAAKV